VGQNRRTAEHGLASNPGGNAMNLLLVPGGPDLGPKQAKAPLHKWMIEMPQNDVIAIFHRFWVKRDGPFETGVCGWIRP
jgi:hypothetical protein